MAAIICLFVLVNYHAPVNAASTVTPEMYGAVSDGQTDCTTALQKAFDAAKGGGMVVLGNAGKKDATRTPYTYLYSAPLYTRGANIVARYPGSYKSILLGNTPNCALIVTGNGSTLSGFWVQNTTPVENLFIVDNCRQGLTYNTFLGFPVPASGNGISVRGDGVNLTGLSFQNIPLNAIDIEDRNTVTVTNCSVVSAGGNGITVLHSNNIVLNGNSITSSTSPVGICIGGNYHGGSQNITLTGNTCSAHNSAMGYLEPVQYPNTGLMYRYAGIFVTNAFNVNITKNTVAGGWIQECIAIESFVSPPSPVDLVMIGMGPVTNVIVSYNNIRNIGTNMVDLNVGIGAGVYSVPSVIAGFNAEGNGIVRTPTNSIRGFQAINNTITAPNFAGIVTGPVCYGATITGNTISDCGEYTWYDEGHEYAIVSLAGFGIITQNNGPTTISNNIITNTWQNGIALFSPNGGTTSVTGNILKFCGVEGKFLSTGDGASCSVIGVWNNLFANRSYIVPPQFPPGLWVPSGMTGGGDATRPQGLSSPSGQLIITDNAYTAPTNSDVSALYDAYYYSGDVNNPNAGLTYFIDDEIPTSLMPLEIHGNTQVGTNPPLPNNLP